MQATMSGQFESAGMLFGRRTYDDLVGYWLSTSEPNPFTDILARTPKYVASRDPAAALPYPNSTLLAGEAVDTVAALKRSGDGGLVVLGSGALVRDLAAAGLVDRYVLTILPIVLGRGARLFDSTYAELELESSTTSPTGIVVASYRVLRG
ncbi:MAG: dihydrofolate reductase family protein [Nocardioidaceae bacterium]